MLIPILCVSSALRPGPASPAWLSGLKFETREVHAEESHRQTATPVQPTMGAAASSALVLLSLEGSRASASDNMYDFSITREAGRTAHVSQHSGGRRLSERPRFTLSAIRRRWAQSSRQLVENSEEEEKSQQCVPPSLADDDKGDGPENNLDAAAVDLGVLAGAASNSSSCAEGEVCLPSASSPTGGLCQDGLLTRDDSTCPEDCPAEVCDCYHQLTFNEHCLKSVADSCKDGSYVSSCEQAPMTSALEESNLAARQGTCDVYTCVLDTCGDTPPHQCYSEASYDCYCQGYAATCKLYSDICSLGVDGSGMTRNQWSNACYYAPVVCNLASCCTCNSGYICIAEPEKAVSCSTAESDEGPTGTTSSSKHSLAKGAPFVAAVSMAIATSAISMFAGH